MTMAFVSTFSSVPLARRTASLSSSGYASVRDDNALERLYREVGAIRGPFALREGREELARLFAVHGAAGLEWLMTRLEGELNAEASVGGSQILARWAGSTSWAWALLFERVRQLLSGPSGLSESVAESALRALGRSVTPEDHEDDVRELVKRLSGHRDPTLRELAIDLAATLVGPLDEVLAPFLADPDEYVRETARETLAEDGVSD